MCPEARLLSVTGLRTALADPDLLAEDVPHHPRRHLRPGGECPVALAAQKEDVGVKGLPFVGFQPVDEQLLAFAHAVLLPADRDDRV